ncbi:MAG: hypothetical protein ACJA1E_000914 [Paracoccaceae bacterium]
MPWSFVQKQELEMSFITKTLAALCLVGFVAGCAAEPEVYVEPVMAEPASTKY